MFRENSLVNFHNPKPTQARLTEHFRVYIERRDQDGEVVPAEGLFGAIYRPEQTPKALLSVDLCEVLRQTGAACSKALKKRPSVDYPYTLSTGWNCEQRIGVLISNLMNRDEVPPVEKAEEIHQILQRMRALGVFVLANTSTLPGCEVATIRFLQDHFPKGFDGINFNTGGHHGTGSSYGTKAQAARKILRQIASDGFRLDRSFWVGSIDDRPYHNDSFYEEFREAKVYSVAPLYKSEIPKPAHRLQTVLADTPYSAFEAAFNHMRAWQEMLAYEAQRRINEPKGWPA